MHHVFRRIRRLHIITKSTRGGTDFLFWRTMATQTSNAGSGDGGARTYNDAIDALNTLQTPYALVEARRKAGIRPDASSIAEMHVYLRRIGYAADDLDRLNVVHVAGTKGKGSTCAFTTSILSHHQRAGGNKNIPRRIGLFTSPHLIAVRERIRIDGAPISEAAFARYFFEVWDRLGEAEAREGPLPAIDQRLLLQNKHGNKKNGDSDSAAAEPLPVPVPAPSVLMYMPPRPIYARFLTLMSFHVFLREGVDAAVYETGIGGEYDATNVVPRPVATGIATLGIDHVFALGKTVDAIAWHKAGIMKPGSPAFTIPQVPEAAEVLARRAAEKGVDLRVLDIDPRLQLPGGVPVAVRPDAPFQKKNATLGIALAEAALQKLDPAFRPGGPEDPLPKAFVDGIEQVVWRGRCEVKVEGPVVWHVDGAHTVDSLRMATRWFADECAAAAAAAAAPSTSSSSSTPSTAPAKTKTKKALIFNQQGREEAVDFLEGMVATLRSRDQGSFDHVIFCSNVTYAQSGYKRDFVNHQHDPAAIKALTAQHGFARRWAALDPESEVEVVPTIEDAINRVRELGAKPEAEAEASAGGGGGGQVVPVRAFITGSLHLVGGALGILEGADAL